MAVQATLAWEEKGSHPRAQRGPVAGATTQFSLAPSIGVFGFVPVWARSIFSSSRVVVRAWCPMPRSSAALAPAAVLCERVLCARRAGWREGAVQDANVLELGSVGRFCTKPYVTHSWLVSKEQCGTHARCGRARERSDCRE